MQPTLALLSFATSLFLPSHAGLAPSLAGAGTASLSGEPLAIECPDDSKIFCGPSIGPEEQGTPIVTGGCDAEPTVTYEDFDMPVSPCATDRFSRDIKRVWTASDSCGNSVSCEQMIHVVKLIATLDIKPTSCPNPFQLKSGGLLPAALLGSAGFDVTQIDPASIQIWTEHCAAGPVSPIGFNYEDVSTPYSGNVECGCNTLAADGFLDLTLKFDKKQVEQKLKLGSYPKNTFVKLFVTGSFLNGCEFAAVDCVRVQ